MAQAAKGVISNCDALVELLESIEHFVSRLDIYTWIPSTAAVDEIVVKILMELISILALVTESLKRQCSSESVLTCVLLCSASAVKLAKRFFKEIEIEAVLKRLDRLTQAEARATAVHTLAVVHGLIQNMGEFMDGRQTNSAVVHRIEYPFSLDRNASIDDVRKDLSTFFWLSRVTSVSNWAQKSSIK